MLFGAFVFVESCWSCDSAGMGEGVEGVVMGKSDDEVEAGGVIGVELPLKYCATYPNTI